MNQKLERKLLSLPRTPGVYFHKDASGEIIYIGKAAMLKNRVRQYFQSSRDMDVKTLALVAEIDDTDWVETDSEIDALFLESEMVKRYMPRFNILLRDDKSQTYVRIDMKSDWPSLSFTRNPADDKADYFGPFYNNYALRKALRYLRKIFPYYTKPVVGERPDDLDVHLGLSPGLDMTSSEYKANLARLILYLKGGHKTITKDIEKDMKRAAKVQDFETAVLLRNRMRYLSELQRRIMFGDKEFLDISKDRALADLRDLLSLPTIPTRIEGYDISHMSGVNVVASQVVFINGVSSRQDYRKYKTKLEQNDDFFNMNETIGRRLSDRNLKVWGKPNLLLIDGGKGQLDAALKARDERGQIMPAIGLAKREEQIVVDVRRSGITIDTEKLAELDGRLTHTENFTLINLPHSTHIIKLLQRIRDESHRFAVSYHTVLKRQKQTASNLDEIPGIGPATRKKLLKTFGSLRGINAATIDELEIVVGETKAKTLLKFLPL